MNPKSYTIETKIVKLFCNPTDIVFANPLELPYNIFRNPSLRFLLGNPNDYFDAKKVNFDNGGNHFQEMYINSIYNSKELYTNTFIDSGKIWIILKFWEQNRLQANQLPSEFERLVNFGFELTKYQQPQFHERNLNKEKIEIGHEDGFEYSYAFEIDKSYENVGVIIRAICGKELGISFCPNAIAYFVDLENKVLMHIYDDRGMVIVTKKSDKIINLYTKFSHLLNPHYIQEMSEIFERIE